MSGLLEGFFLIALAAALFVPPFILYRNGAKLQWRIKYLLSVFPALYSGGGWAFGLWAYGWFGCQGDLKHLSNCQFLNFDVTPLVGHGVFLMIPFVFVAAPLSGWLLLDTAAKHIGSRRQRADW